jgi:prevent-host-death family protein
MAMSPHDIYLSGYNSLVKRASVTEAKNRLSALLDHVRQGESVLIEDRGVPVAQLNPVPAHALGPDQDRVARLVRQGILRPPISDGETTRLDTAPPKSKQRVSLSRLVIEERRTGR